MNFRRAIVVSAVRGRGYCSPSWLLGHFGAAHPRARDTKEADEQFVSLRVAELNDELLKSAGTSAEDWRQVAPEWFGSNTAASFQRDVAEVLIDEFGEAQLFVLEDPRICRLVPFWRSALAKLGVQASWLFVLQSPADSGAVGEDGEVLAADKLLRWVFHSLAFERATRGLPRIIVSPYTLAKEMRNPTYRIPDELKIMTRSDGARGKRTSHGLIKRATPKAVCAGGAFVEQVYSALLELEVGSPGHRLHVLDDVQRLLSQAVGLFGPYLFSLESELEMFRQTVEANRNELSQLVRSRTEVIREVEWLRQELSAQSLKTANIVSGDEIDGCVDYWDRVRISGWARSKVRPGPVRVECYYEGRLVADALADRFRSDLVVAVPDGRCAFEITLLSECGITYPAHFLIRAQGSEAPLKEGRIVVN